MSLLSVKNSTKYSTSSLDNSGQFSLAYWKGTLLAAPQNLSLASLKEKQGGENSSMAAAIIQNAILLYGIDQLVKIAQNATPLLSKPDSIR